MQTTAHVLMIRPLHFGYNAETAVNNGFQIGEDQAGVRDRALGEFDALVNALRTRGVDVTVVEDSPEPHTPDAVFPNNWISFHEPHTVCLFPMFAPNRRAERKPAVLEALAQRFPIWHRIDLTHYEASGQFLEGTGSMVLDRDHRIAYAGLSPRTDAAVLDDFCRQTGYRSCCFHAADARGQLIYHSNVMMCVADRFVVICLESIRDPAERKTVTDCIGSTGKEIIPISMDQLHHFAGNMLQLENAEKKKLLVMSTNAFDHLTTAQREKLSAYNELLHASLTCIETNGGGSARCMIAEIHGFNPSAAVLPPGSPAKNQAPGGLYQ